MAYEMVAAIAGDMLLELDAIESLLDWYLPDDCYILFSNAVNPGLQRIQYWMTEVNQDWGLNPGFDDTLIQNLCTMIESNSVTELSLIVLGIEGNEKLIQQAWQNGIEVADLSRALYIVQQGVDLDDALYEPVRDADGLSDGPGGRGSGDVFISQDAIQSRGFSPNVKNTWTREEIEEIVTGLILVHERGFATGGVIMKEQAPVVSESGHKENLVRCLKNESGKIRVSPRAKAKAGEEEVWLTQEEIDAA